MGVPTFDIFAGLTDKDAIWIECVQGLGMANDRMKELAAARPGPYFVFDSSTHKILAKIDTTHQTSEPHENPLTKPEDKIDEVA